MEKQCPNYISEGYFSFCINALGKRHEYTSPCIQFFVLNGERMWHNGFRINKNQILLGAAHIHFASISIVNNLSVGMKWVWPI